MAHASSLQRFRVDGITGRTVGYGTYATVLELGLKCVSKRPHLILFESARAEERADMLRLMEKECELLSQLRHPNIVQCFGVHWEKSSQLPAFVMEYLPTSLRAALDAGCELLMATKYGIMRDVALGLRYLHELDPPIIHRDLSVDSVFLTSNFMAKISSVGITKMLDPAENAASQPMAPEMLADVDCNSKIDIYSYGVLIRDMLNGKQPIPLFSPSDSGIADTSVPGEYEVGYRAHCVTGPISNDHPLSKLGRQCRSPYPSQRPEATVILQQLSTAMPLVSTTDFQQFSQSLAESEDDVDAAQLQEKYTQSPGGLRRENERLTRELHALKRENRRLRDNIRTVGSENERLRVTIQEIGLKGQRMTDEMRCLEMQRDTTQKENLELKKAVYDFQTRIQDMETTISQHELDLVDAKQLHQSLKQEEEDSIKEKKRLTHELEAVKSENERLELDMEGKQKLYMEELKALQCENQTLRQEVVAIKSSNQETEEKLTSAAKTDKMEILRLQQELEAATDENGQLQQRAKINQRLKRDQQELKTDNERLGLDCKLHKSEVEYLQKELQQQTETTRRQNEKLQQEREANERLKQELETTKRENDDHKQHLKLYRQKEEEVEQRLKHEEEEKQRLRAETEATQREVQQLRKKVEAAMASLRQEVKDARSEFLKLTHDVKMDVSQSLQKLRE